MSSASNYGFREHTGILVPDLTSLNQLLTLFEEQPDKPIPSSLYAKLSKPGKGFNAENASLQHDLFVCKNPSSNAKDQKELSEYEQRFKELFGESHLPTALNEKGSKLVCDYVQQHPVPSLSHEDLLATSKDVQDRLKFLQSAHQQHPLTKHLWQPPVQQQTK